MRKKTNQPTHVAVRVKKISSKQHADSLDQYAYVNQPGDRLCATLRRPYTMQALLAASEYPRDQAKEDREWVDAPLVGDELL